MAFQKAALVSAVLASAALVKAAPMPLEPRQMFNSSCKLQENNYGTLSLEGFPLSIGTEGTVVAGGVPFDIAPAVCSDKDGTTTGYFVNARDHGQCLTVSNLDQNEGTFSFSDCRFNGAGDVWASQTFSWIKNQGKTDVYFAGDSAQPVSSSKPTNYSFKTVYSKPSFQGTLGELSVDYNQNQKSLPQALTLSVEGHDDSTPPPQDLPLKCSGFLEGQLYWNNGTAEANGYNGLVNSKWQADASTTDKFVFETCDYSSSGLKASGDVTYGRLRPGSDLGNGEYTCYEISENFGDSGSKHTPTNDPWINEINTVACSYAQDSASQFAVLYNNRTGTINYVPFPGKAAEGELYWYTSEFYKETFGTKQTLKDPAAIGAAYLSSSNSVLQKHPAGTISFKAGPGAN